MDRLECANCGLQITSTGPCPKCGSTEKMVLYNLLDRPELLTGFSLTIVAPVQIWTYLPSAIKSHLSTIKTSKSNYEIKGLCLVSIFSTAALIEGIATDYIETELVAMCDVEEKRDSYQKLLRSLEFKAWAKKLKLAVDTLEWKLYELESFHIIDLLFKLRDQIGHGKSYMLMDRRHMKENKLQQIGPVAIGGVKYGEIYHELSRLGLVVPIEQHPSINVDMFLLPSLADDFYNHAIIFLRSFMKSIRLKRGIDMSDLLESLLK